MGNTGKISLQQAIILRKAAKICEDYASYTRISVTDGSIAIDIARGRLLGLEHEEFHVLYLDNQHGLICAEKAFQGTIDASAVYPREIVKRALANNAAAVIFAHNHPSGVARPSEGDKRITTRLQEALALVDIRVLDHLIIGRDSFSFAGAGLL